MTRFLSWFVKGAAILLLLAGEVSGEPVALPETVPAQRLEEILTLVHAGDRDSLASYATTHFTPEPPHRVRGLFTYRASPVLGAGDVEPVMPADLPGRLEALVGRLAAEDDFAGSVCLARDGETLFSGAWGLANRETETANRTSTLFNLASLGKMFTAVAVLQIVETGALHLDDPVSSYVPDWLGPGTEEITVKQLLTHRSGLGDYLGPAMEDRSRTYSRLEDYRPLVVGDTLLFPPGEGIQYSNTGFLLLGVVIQVVSGRPWDRYIEEEVFGRADMIASRAYRPQTEDGTVATGYYQEEMGGEWLPNTDLLVGWGTPAGGSAATAEDLVAFAQALKVGRLLTKESVQAMTTPRNEIPGTGRYSGYGVMITGGEPGTRLYGHAGGFPGVSSLLEIDEKHGYVLAVVANQRSAQQVRGAWSDLLRASR